MGVPSAQGTIQILRLNQVRDPAAGKPRDYHKLHKQTPCALGFCACSREGFLEAHSTVSQKVIEHLNEPPSTLEACRRSRLIASFGRGARGLAYSSNQCRLSALSLGTWLFRAIFDESTLTAIRATRVMSMPQSQLVDRNRVSTHTVEKILQHFSTDTTCEAVCGVHQHARLSLQARNKHTPLPGR